MTPSKQLIQHLQRELAAATEAEAKAGKRTSELHQEAEALKDGIRRTQGQIDNGMQQLRDQLEESLGREEHVRAEASRLREALSLSEEERSVLREEAAVARGAASEACAAADRLSPELREALEEADRLRAELAEVDESRSGMREVLKELEREAGNLLQVVSTEKEHCSAAQAAPERMFASVSPGDQDMSFASRSAAEQSMLDYSMETAASLREALETVVKEHAASQVEANGLRGLVADLQMENNRIDMLLQDHERSLDMGDEELPLSERLNARLERLQTLLIEATEEKDRLGDQVQEALALARGIISGTEALLEAAYRQGLGPGGDANWRSGDGDASEGRGGPSHHDDDDDGDDDDDAGGGGCGGRVPMPGVFPAAAAEQHQQSPIIAASEGSLGPRAAEEALRGVRSDLSRLVASLQGGSSASSSDAVEEHRRHPERNRPLHIVSAAPQLICTKDAEVSSVVASRQQHTPPGQTPLVEWQSDAAEGTAASPQAHVRRPREAGSGQHQAMIRSSVAALQAVLDEAAARDDDDSSNMDSGDDASEGSRSRQAPPLLPRKEPEPYNDRDCREGTMSGFDVGMPQRRGLTRSASVAIENSISNLKGLLGIAVAADSEADNNRRPEGRERKGSDIEAAAPDDGDQPQPTTEAHGGAGDGSSSSGEGSSSEGPEPVSFAAEEGALRSLLGGDKDPEESHLGHSQPDGSLPSPDEDSVSSKGTKERLEELHQGIFAASSQKSERHRLARSSNQAEDCAAPERTSSISLDLNGAIHSNIERLQRLLESPREDDADEEEAPAGPDDQLLEQMREVEGVLESALVLRDHAEGAPEEPPSVPTEELCFEASLAAVAKKDHSNGEESGGNAMESPFVTDNPVRSSSGGGEQRSPSSRRGGSSDLTRLHSITQQQQQEPLQGIAMKVVVPADDTSSDEGDQDYVMPGKESRIGSSAQTDQQRSARKARKAPAADEDDPSHGSGGEPRLQAETPSSPVSAFPWLPPARKSRPRRSSEPAEELKDRKVPQGPSTSTGPARPFAALPPLMDDTSSEEEEDDDSPSMMVPKEVRLEGIKPQAPRRVPGPILDGTSTTSLGIRTEGAATPEKAPRASRGPALPDKSPPRVKAKKKPPGALKKQAGAPKTRSPRGQIDLEAEDTMGSSGAVQQGVSSLSLGTDSSDGVPVRVVQPQGQQPDLIQRHLRDRVPEEDGAAEWREDSGAEEKEAKERGSDPLESGAEEHDEQQEKDEEEHEEEEHEEEEEVPDTSRLPEPEAETCREPEAKEPADCIEDLNREIGRLQAKVEELSSARLVDAAAAAQPPSPPAQLPPSAATTPAPAAEEETPRSWIGRLLLIEGVRRSVSVSNTTVSSRDSDALEVPSPEVRLATGPFVSRPTASCLVPGREEEEEHPGEGAQEEEGGLGDEEKREEKKTHQEGSSLRPPSPWPKAARKAARLAALQREAEDAKTIEKLNKEVEALELQVEMLQDKLEQAQHLGTPSSAGSPLPCPSLWPPAQGIGSFSFRGRPEAGRALSQPVEALREELDNAIEDRESLLKWVSEYKNAVEDVVQAAAEVDLIAEPPSIDFGLPPRAGAKATTRTSEDPTDTASDGEVHMGERAERLIGWVEGVPDEQPHDSPEIQELSVVAASEETDEAAAEAEPGAVVAAEDATGIEETSTREGPRRHSVDAIRAVAAALRELREEKAERAARKELEVLRPQLVELVGGAHVALQLEKEVDELRAALTEAAEANEALSRRCRAAEAEAAACAQMRGRYSSMEKVFAEVRELQSALQMALAGAASRESKVAQLKAQLSDALGALHDCQARTGAAPGPSAHHPRADQSGAIGSGRAPGRGFEFPRTDRAASDAPLWSSGANSGPSSSAPRQTHVPAAPGPLSPRSTNGCGDTLCLCMHQGNEWQQLDGRSPLKPTAAQRANASHGAFSSPPAVSFCHSSSDHTGGLDQMSSRASGHHGRFEPPSAAPREQRPRSPSPGRMSPVHMGWVSRRSVDPSLVLSGGPRGLERPSWMDEVPREVAALDPSLRKESPEARRGRSVSPMRRHFEQGHSNACSSRSSSPVPVNQRPAWIPPGRTP